MMPIQFIHKNQFFIEKSIMRIFADKNEKQLFRAAQGLFACSCLVPCVFGKAV